MALRVATFLGIFVSISSWAGAQPFNYYSDDAQVPFCTEDGSAAPFDVVLRIEDEAAAPAATTAFSMALSHNGMYLEVVDVVAIGDLAAVGPDFFAANLSPGMDTGFVLGVVYDFTLMTTLAFPGPTPVVRATYEVVPDDLIGTVDNTETDLVWTPIGMPVTFNVVVLAGGDEFADETIDGTVTLIPNQPFIRGDTNNSGILTVGDAYTILAWMFSGGPAPTCMETADVDDNGVVSPLVDAYLLIDIVTGGGPTMPPPFPDCGCDLTTTPDCVSYTGC